MKVIFALRADAFSKPGGDSKKIERYQLGLKGLGWDSQIVTTARDLKNADSDIIHLVNLDTPRENLRYAQIASKKQVPFVISTIRHPFAGMVSMYKHGEDRFYQSTGRFGVGPELGIGFREQVKLVKNGNVAAALIPGRYRRLQEILVNRAAGLFPMASGEAADLYSDFKTRTPHWVIRNGSTFSSTDAHQADLPKIYDLVSVGRIEPRKNSLALAKAAGDTGLKTVFVGALNLNHKGYAQRFLQEIETHENLEYLGQKDHAEITGILGECDVYINPAWFEVVSQADVEAASLDLRVASTRHSYLEDALGKSVLRFDPADLQQRDAGRRLLSLFENARKVPGAANRSWLECSTELDAAYKSILGAL